MSNRKIRVAICCRDDSLRSLLVECATVDSVDVSVSGHHSLLELKGSTWHAGVLCAVADTEQEEQALRDLSISEDTVVIVLCARDRIEQWKPKILDGAFDSYVTISPVQDTFDLKIRIRRAVERACTLRELAFDREQLQQAGQSEHDELPDNGRILVVEDNPAARELLTDLLEPEGYVVKHATSVVNACRDFELESFRAILVDLMMPGISGPNVVKVIRERLGDRDTPVIVTSSHSQPDIIADCMKLGATDFLVKPITRAKLLARLDAALHD